MASVVDLSSPATAVTLMLGLSCGIDYGLFIVSRHRGQLLGGMAVEESIARAVGTAGSAVVFAGATVLIALAGIAVLGIPFLTALGLAAAGAVFLAVVLAVTLLPALLAFAGERVARTSRLPGFGARAERVARRGAEDPESTLGGAWARFVVRRRVPVLLSGVALLGLLAVPVASLELGLPTAETQPTSNTARQAYDLTSRAFGAGSNGALLVTATEIRTPEQVQPTVDALAAMPDVAAASVASITNELAIITVIPTSGPNDPGTRDLVDAIRDDRDRLQDLGSSPSVLVGGITASNIDVSEKVFDALPVFLLVIVVVAMLLLTFAFRTFWVPLKSVVGFLLSLGAALGATVAVFQWGWGADVLGVTPGPIVTFLPVLMLAIVFGLSADYEIFVVSRIKEQYALTGDARTAVVRGTALSARVVTAAALVMVTIFAAFLAAPEPTLKAFGFSFAMGVLIDAFVVRLTLVPAFMALVGDRIWDNPAWFARLPKADIEGERLHRYDTDHVLVPVPIR